MARPEKVAVVEEIRAKLGAADAAVLTEYRGLTVTAIAELRGALRPAGAQYKVFKNTLARRAAEAAGLTELIPLLEGPTAIAFISGDAVVAAKALRDFGRTNAALVIKGGLLGPRILTPADVEALAEIQPREVLLARMAGGFQAPLTKAAGLFQAFSRNAAYAFKALIDQRVAAGEAAPPAEVDAPAADEAPAAEETPAADEAPADEAPAVAAPAAESTDEPAAGAGGEPAAAADADAPAES
jgi:large subunit ribosomal protein L10